MLKKSEYNVYYQVLVLCSVRRPIGFRPPSDRIPNAARSDCERRPIRFRTPSEVDGCVEGVPNLLCASAPSGVLLTSFAPSHFLSVEVVAETEACDDALRKTSYFLAQTCDVYVHRAVEHEHILRPHAVDKLLAREYASSLVE